MSASILVFVVDPRLVGALLYYYVHCLISGSKPMPCLLFPGYFAIVLIAVADYFCRITIVRFLEGFVSKNISVVKSKVCI